MDGEWIVPGFRHTRQLGDGATGLVMQAVHLETGTPVAIKYLAPELVHDEEFLFRFREEARLLAELRDPHVVTFHEYVEGPHGAAIVMELVDGVSLATLINSEGSTGPEVALYVLKGSLLGLAAAHAAGVVHRDYKPGNVLVDGNGDSKLADFGVAVRAGENVPSAGTPAYMAPEQWGGRPVSPATDVYAATAVFFECLTGHSPYPGATLPQLALAHRTAAIPIAGVPDALRLFVEHGMAKDHLARPQSALEFLSELEATALAAYGIGWEERGRDTLRERAALLAMLFPLGHHSEPQVGATEMGTTTMAATDFADYFADNEAPPAPPSGPPVDQDYGIDWGDDRDRRPTKTLLAVGAAILGLLVLGGGTAAIYAANSGSTATAAPKTTLSPSGVPTATDSPTDTPTDSSSPTTTPTSTSPTPSPTSTTTAPAAPAPAPATTSANPKPTPTKPTKTPTPPLPKTQVSGVSILRWTQSGTTSGVGTAVITTSGTGSVSLSVSYLGDGTSLGSDGPVTLSGKISYTVSLSFNFSANGGCTAKNWGVSVQASAPGGNGGDSKSFIGNCLA